MGAARYVGRVGALALMLGVGAAVAGGAGLAKADGTTDTSPGGGGGVQSSSDSTAGEGVDGTRVDVDSPADESSGVKTRKPGSSTVPKMVLASSGGALTSELPGHQQGGVTDPNSPPGLIASVPNQIAALVVEDATGTRGSVKSPPGVRPKPRSGSAAVGDVTAAPFVRRMADDPGSARPAGGRPLDVVPSGGAVHEQRLTVSPDPTTAPETTEFTAPVQAPPGEPIATMVSGQMAALDITSSASTGGSPKAPMTIVPAGLPLISRELEQTFLSQASIVAPSTAAPRSLVTTVGVVGTTQSEPVTTPGVPSPADAFPTPYADVGKWLLQSDGQISNWGGQPHDGKVLLEPINVIILDPTSTTPDESIAKLNAAMSRAGFPAQGLHSAGFHGAIDGETYGQQPSGVLQAFSDNFFLLPNDHGRMFGPAPASSGTGFVWTGAFSTEQFGSSGGQFGHEYVSFDMARNVLAAQLIASGAGTLIGVVPLGNAYDTETETTGDHDGYAVVLQLNPMVAPRQALNDRGQDSTGMCVSLEGIRGSQAWFQAMDQSTDQCVTATSVPNAAGRHAKS